MKVGDTIIIGDRTVKIVGKVTAGKCYRWHLDDGTQELDLESRADVKVVPVKSARKKKTETIEDYRKDDSIGEDFLD